MKSIETVERAIVRAVKRVAFGEFQAHRLWLDVLARSSPKRALYKSEEFFEEGTLRDCRRVAGGFESLVAMSLIAQELNATEGTTTERT